jgi:hypothetical protein
LLSQASGQLSLWSASLNLGANYQITRFVSAYGSYVFFMQRSGGSSSTQAADVDQNTGSQSACSSGYPINFGLIPSA